MAEIGRVRVGETNCYLLRGEGGTVLVDPGPPGVAVLPFVNRSAGDSDAFFTDGLHDELLTQLSKIAGIKVISRTSVEKFRGTTQSMGEIGDGVDYGLAVLPKLEESGQPMKPWMKATSLVVSDSATAATKTEIFFTVHLPQRRGPVAAASAGAFLKTGRRSGRAAAAAPPAAARANPAAAA